MADELSEFLRHEVSLPPYDGACCRIADKWITQRTGASALRRYGRDFTDGADVEAWLKEPGGITVAVNRVMRACGYQKTKDPQPGDVGLVLHKQRLCMAICAPSGWFSRDESGLILVPHSAVWKAWRIPPGD
jgi:hypothetical protein